MSFVCVRASCHSRRSRRVAFTLIEVLVVVAIIALLVAILLPSLAAAKEQARLIVCQSTLHQLGLAITTYAQTQRTIPFGPAVEGIPPYMEANDGKLATSQIWTGPQGLTAPDPANSPLDPNPQRMALGLLMGKVSDYRRIMFCPADDTTNPVEEYNKLTDPSRAYEPAFGSYEYRQLQATSGRGRLEDLGKNSDDPQTARKATALAFDLNSVITDFPGMARSNHNGKRVNVLYVDASVRSYDNKGNIFSLRNEDVANDPDVDPVTHIPKLIVRRTEMFREADKRY